MEEQGTKNNGILPTAIGTDGREARSKFWIAAYTRPKSEKKASSLLNHIGIETYLPLQTEVRQWSDRKKKMDVVIIPNIIFAYIEESDIMAIRQNHLISKILSIPGCKKPAHIPTDQIERLKFMLKESDYPVSFRNIDFKKSDTVMVVRGKLKGLTGIVERISENRAILIVLIDLLGGAMVEINSADLDMASTI